MRTGMRPESSPGKWCRRFAHLVGVAVAASGREEFDLLFLGDGWLFLGSWGQKSAH